MSTIRTSPPPGSPEIDRMGWSTLLAGLGRGKAWADLTPAQQERALRLSEQCMTYAPDARHYARLGRRTLERYLQDYRCPGGEPLPGASRLAALQMVAGALPPSDPRARVYGG